MDCRLCSNSELTIDMFNSDGNTAKLKLWRFYILATTGLEIRKDDIVSKMVCHTCCEFVEKIYKFRNSAVENDKLLKERLGLVYLPPVTDPEELQQIGFKILEDQTDYDNGKAINNNTLTTNKIDSISKIVSKSVFRHDSVNSLINEYPGIKLPKEIYKCDINPVITLDENEIKDWHEECFSRFQERLSLGNIKIKRVDNSVNNNSVNNYKETKCKNGRNKSNTALLDEILDMLVVNENVPITKSTTADQYPLINRLCLSVNKQSVCKPCPKSKKALYMPDMLNSQPESLTLCSKETEENLITDISEVLSPLDSSKTQINHVSTTTLDTVVHKRKRKSRKRRLLPELTPNEIIPQKKPRIYYNKNGLSPLSKLDIPERIPTNITEHKKLLASSLELKPTAEPADSNDILACSMCSKLYDTSKQLRKHQKRHLGRKSRGSRHSSTKPPQIKEDQHSHIKILKNPPKIKLTRVDKVRSIADQYPSAFGSDVTGSDVDTNCVTLSTVPAVTTKVQSVSKQSIPVSIGQAAATVANHPALPTLKTDRTPRLNGHTLKPPIVEQCLKIESRKETTASLATTPVINTIRKPPPPSPQFDEETVLNIFAPSSSAVATTVAGRTPDRPKEFCFTDEELLEMLSAPVTADNLPNTTFHYGQISAVSSEGLDIKPAVKTREELEQTPRVSSTIQVEDTPVQLEQGPNRTVPQISTQVSENDAIIETPLTEYTDLELDMLAQYLQPDQTILTNLYEAHYAQPAEQWLQSDMTQSSAVQAQNTSIEQWSAPEALYQPSVPIVPGGTPSYNIPTCDQMNYYNDQGGYKNPYAPNANFPNYSNSTSVNTHVVSQKQGVPYTNMSPTYKQNMNVLNPSNTNPNTCNLRSDSLQNVNSNRSIHRYMVPNPCIPENVPKVNQKHAQYAHAQYNPINTPTSALRHSNPGLYQLLSSNPTSANAQHPNFNSSQSLNQPNANHVGNVAQRLRVNSNQPVNTPAPPATVQYSYPNSTHSINRPNVNFTNTLQYSNELVNVNNTQQSANARQYYNSAPPHSTGTPNANQNVNVNVARNPSPSYSLSSRSSANCRNSVTSSTEQIPRASIRVKPLWDLINF